MKITAHILDILKRERQVSVPGFGVFSIKNSGAKILEDSGKILPPVAKVDFQIDYENGDKTLLQKIAAEEGFSFETAQAELEKLTEYWKKSLVETHEIEIDNLGKLHQNENGTVFIGNRIDVPAEDFYGLEEINLKELKTSGSSNSASGYHLSTSGLWLFLFILLVLGLLVLAFTQREKLFGKKSFDELQVKRSTHRITEDSSKIKAAVADSIRTDSLRQDSLKKIAVVPAKKWSNKKKYSKKTWRKAKKQVTRKRS